MSKHYITRNNQPIELQSDDIIPLMSCSTCGASAGSSCTRLINQLDIPIKSLHAKRVIDYGIKFYQ